MACLKRIERFVIFLLLKVIFVAPAWPLLRDYSRYFVESGIVKRTLHLARHLFTSQLHERRFLQHLIGNQALIAFELGFDF